MINLDKVYKKNCIIPNPNIKIKIVTLNRTQVLKVDRNKFTPNKDMLVIYAHRVFDCVNRLKNIYSYVNFYNRHIPSIITWYAIFLVNLAQDLALAYTRDLL